MLSRSAASGSSENRFKILYNISLRWSCDRKENLFSSNLQCHQVRSGRIVSEMRDIREVPGSDAAGDLNPLKLLQET